MMNEVKSKFTPLQIDENDLGQRLDQLLVLKTSVVSRAHAQKLIKDQKILVDKRPSKSSYKITSIDCLIEVIDPIEEPSIAVDLISEDIDLEIIHEDQDMIVINKPTGMVTHPAPGHPTGTLVNALLHKMQFDQDPENLRPGIVHRLDKDTSGLIVVAKNLRAQNALSEQFKEKTAFRKYKALCYGSFKKEEDTIESLLDRHPKERKKYSSQSQGKFAKTQYKVINNGPLSLVELILFTGRTHQIRVHLSELGHPILNDDIYGQVKRINGITDPALKAKIKGVKRMALVAIELNLNHPVNSEKMNFKIDWPKELDIL